MKKENFLLKIYNKIRLLIKNSKDIAEDVWKPSNPQRPLNLGKVGFRLISVVSITVGGVIKNKIPRHAAALSYYSLMSLGPLIALAVMISGFVLQYNDDEDFAANTLNRLIYFIAPPVQETTQVNADEASDAVDLQSGATAVADAQTDAAQEAPLNPYLVQLIDNMIEKAQSGTVGLLGSLILILIAIQLFIVIEKTFNMIWGVRYGRTLIQRVFVYWTMLSLGAVLGFAAISTLTASKVDQVFDTLPLGAQLIKWADFMAPAISSVGMILLLSIFYCFIPNTRVRWIPALIGASIVVLVLFLNNYLSFLYINKVLQAQSLYGSISIILILMLGLYIFWLVILLGGQVTYSIQNAHFLSVQKAWDNVSFHSQEFLSLAVLIFICRRFKQCDEPPSTDTINRHIQIPRRILNETLLSLEEMGWIHQVQGEKASSQGINFWQPARPLNAIKLRAFRESFENYGNNLGLETANVCDEPILQYYQKELNGEVLEGEPNPSIDTLIDKLPRGTAQASA